VGRAPLAVVVQNASRASNQPNPIFTGSVTGLVNADTAASTQLTYTTSATQSSAPGTYPITASLGSQLAAANYILSVTPGTLTITGTTTSADLNWPTPAPIVYGTPLVSAQLDATSSVPGTFTYTPAAGTILGAGQKTLSVSFSPTGAQGGSSETATVLLTVTQATTTTALKAVNATTSGAVTLSATVTSINGGAVTGSLQFMDGSTPLNTVTVDTTGTGNYTALLFGGSHSLTAVYAGDANNKASTSTPLLQSVTSGPDFALSANPTVLSLSPGQSTQVTLSLLPSGGLTASVAFTCTGLPQGATCSFQPASITTDGANTAQSAKLTIGLPGGSTRCSRKVGRELACSSVGSILHLPWWAVQHLAVLAAPATATSGGSCNLDRSGSVERGHRLRCEPLE
jgi:MBG domain (YGX type)/Bacterial Ig-like domain (group 3)